MLLGQLLAALDCEDQRFVQLGRGLAHERAYLGGREDVDFAGVTHTRALDKCHRVARQPVDLHRALEDSVEDDQVLLASPV